MVTHQEDPTYRKLSALERHTIDIIALVIKGDSATVEAAIAALVNRQHLSAASHQKISVQ